MKIRAFGFVAVATALLIASCNSGKDNLNEPVLLSKTVEYDVNIVNYRLSMGNPVESSQIWDRENIESSNRLAFLDMLFEKVLSGKLKITDMKDKPVDSAGIKALLSVSDTVRFTKPYEPYDEYDSVVVSMVDFRNITGLRFREEWTYNPATMALSKKVLAYAPIYTSVSHDDFYHEIYGFPKPLFWVLCDGESTQTEIITKRIVYGTSFSPGGNCPVKLDSLKAMTYVDKLLNLAFTDSIASYTWRKGSTADSLVTGPALKKSIYRSDTISIMDASGSPVRDTIITEEPGPITMLRFMEEWSFDVNTMAISKKVTGVCPVIEDYDMETGEFRGYKPLFWVYFSDVWTPYCGAIKLQKPKKK